VPPSELERSAGPIPLWRRPIRFLQSHPIVCLLLLTPGIPEYLSSSSSLTGLVINPPVFFIFLGLNLALYGPGVLLIREVIVRQQKSWPTLLALGTAYGILEEGVALSTLFNPNAGPVGALGFYGHFANISWVWSIGVLMVHVVYSISLPIVLLGVALPQTRGRSLLGRRGIVTAALVLAADVLLLLVIVVRGEHFWMGATIFLGSLATILLLVYLGLRAPRQLLTVATAPRRSNAAFALLGLGLFPVTLVFEGFMGSLAAPAALTFVLLGGFYVIWILLTIPALGSQRNERAIVSLAAGLLAPIMVFGFVAGFPTPIVGVADLAAVLFLRHLWRKYPGTATWAPAVPLGATA
jgi:hypothetical protein